MTRTPDPAIVKMREGLAEAVSFIEHMSEQTGYPGDELAREEYDDKLARFAALSPSRIRDYETRS